MVDVNQCKNILLTGANGLVGFELLKHLAIDKGSFSIKAIVRKIPDVKFEGVEYLIGDITSEMPKSLFNGEKFILLHFAGKMKGANLEDFRSTNVSGFKKILNLYGSQIDLVIFGSSMSVYGQGPFLNIHENQPLSPETDLALSRMEAEKVLVNFCTLNECKYFILRPRFIFGERDRDTLPSLIKLKSKGIQIGDGHQQFSFITVTDYANIILRLISKENPQSDIINISYPRPITFNEIFQLLPSYEIKLKVPSELIIKLGKYLPFLSKLRVKVQLIGQNQVLNIERLKSYYPEISSHDSVKKLGEIIKKFEEK